MRHCILKTAFAALILSLCVPAFAGKKGRGEDSFVLRRHEFSVMGSFYPGRYAFGPNVNPYYAFSYGSPTVGGIYYDAGFYFKEKTSNSWAVAYTYNFSRLFALSASLGYEGFWGHTFSRQGESVRYSGRENFFTLMATARLSWLNRGILRMYSSLGMGCTYDSLAETRRGEMSGTGYERMDDVVFAMQVTPLGISLGKALFGFVEMGVGTAYVGGCCGIGYRF